ncbi:MAG TPA: hypothetical protein PK156_05470 [Polyangium sp.]|nr:hypothetical protein [Polyangium sp.]
MKKTAKMTVAVGFATTIVTMGGIKAASAQDAIFWEDYNGVAIGTGCKSFGAGTDTAILAAGNDLAIIFSNLGVTGPNQLKNCSARVPAVVRQGYYLGQLQQTITYGVVKGFGTTGKITALASFFNQPVSSFSVNVPIGAINNPAVTQTKVDVIPVVSGCGGELRGLFRSDLAVGAQGAGAITLTTQGLDLRYDIVLAFFVCPLP